MPKKSNQFGIISIIFAGTVIAGTKGQRIIKAKMILLISYPIFMNKIINKKPEHPITDAVNKINKVLKVTTPKTRVVSKKFLVFMN